MNYIYTWQNIKNRSETVKGVITQVTDKQLAEDELKMTLEMMKAGWTFVKREMIPVKLNQTEER